MVRIIDAYRKGIISYQDYTNLLDCGYTPNSVYSVPLVPNPGPTNSWTELLDWDCEGLSYKLISIENLDTSYELEYKIECYNDSILINYLNDFIEVSSIFNITLGEPYTDIVVSVRSANYGSSPSYDFAYTNTV